MAGGEKMSVFQSKNIFSEAARHMLFLEIHPIYLTVNYQNKSLI